MRARISRVVNASSEHASSRPLLATMGSRGAEQVAGFIRQLVAERGSLSMQQPVARARELGVVIGGFSAGEFNAITDVPGVLVGQSTLSTGSDIRTGVTAIVPVLAMPASGQVPAALAVGNGHGKFVGATQVAELGVIETPILLTGTLSTFKVADALITYMLARPGYEQVQSLNPVVGETNDGFLSDVRARPLTYEQVEAAIDTASAGMVDEGAVGAGTGTGALGFKAGIGTSSRILTVPSGGSPGAVTIGVLVQANFSGILTVMGVQIPRQSALASSGSAEVESEQRGNSCVIVIGTDAPLDARQLRRVARRSFAGMARVGSDFAGGSGDYALAFSTSRPGGPVMADVNISPIFSATTDCVEEAILNSLFMAQTTTGYEGHTKYAVPHELVRNACAAAKAARGGT